MNPHKQRLEILAELADKFFLAEADENPTHSNYLLRKMTFTADHCFISVFDFLLQKKAEQLQRNLQLQNAKQNAEQKQKQPATASATPGNYSCPKCLRTFGTVKALNAHSRYHLNRDF